MNAKYDTVHKIALLVNEGVTIARNAAPKTIEESIAAARQYALRLNWEGTLGDEARAIILDPTFNLLTSKNNHDST